MLFALLGAVAFGSTCPDPTAVEAATAYDADRTWIHEPGWFAPLTDPDKAPLAKQGYRDDDAMLSLTLGEKTLAWPVASMAYHHVANDVVGDQAVVVTY